MRYRITWEHLPPQPDEFSNEGDRKRLPAAAIGNVVCGPDRSSLDARSSHVRFPKRVPESQPVLSRIPLLASATGYERAVWHRSAGRRVRIGGPGTFVCRRDFAAIADVGGEIPDTVRRHNPAATFASRGCPVGCWFCIVPAMDGRDFTLIDDFEPRPILCDNNLSALPAAFQDHIVERYRATGVPLHDAQSGFEPRTFGEEVFERWKPINRGPWRFYQAGADQATGGSPGRGMR